jgi:hypothetical protein
MRERVERLIERFDEYVEEFNERNLFTGPSVYFHKKTLEMMRQYDEACEVLDDDRFFDYIYATLTSWGLHRMGRGFAKLAELEKIKRSFKQEESRIRSIQSLEITNIKTDTIDSVTSNLWQILGRLQVGVGRTKIVANSKALHHVLPSLIPPIDRQYTLRFFYNHTTLSRGDEVTFKEIYPHFHEIATVCKGRIMGHIGTGMNTSHTKVIDNAIVGFVVKEIKGK